MNTDTAATERQPFARRRSVAAAKGPRLMGRFARGSKVRELRAPETTAPAESKDSVDVKPEIPEITAATLAAVAHFKSIKIETLAVAVGLPLETVKAYFDGRKVALRQATVDLMAAFLGVDLKTGRFTRNQVHVLRLSAMPFFSRRKTFRGLMADMGVLVRESKAAHLRLSGLGIFGRMFSPTYHVLQNDHVRVLFVGSRRFTYKAQFAPNLVSVCEWFKKTAKSSSVRVSLSDTIERITTQDMTPLEFDEIFSRGTAVSWLDVQHTARANQVSKAELQTWIQQTGADRGSEYRRPDDVSIGQDLSDSEDASLPNAGAGEDDTHSPNLKLVAAGG